MSLLLPTTLQTSHSSTDAPALCFGSKVSLSPSQENKGKSVPSDSNASASFVCTYQNMEDRVFAEPFDGRCLLHCLMINATPLVK